MQNMQNKKTSIRYQQSFNVLQVTKNFKIKKGRDLYFSTTGGNFDPNFPKDYHSIGDTAPDEYLKNVFRLGYIHSIVASYYHKMSSLTYTDRILIHPLLEKIYILYDHSPILKELSILYLRNKIVEEKTQQVFLFMDKLNLTLTLYINLMIAVFIDIDIINIQELCDSIDYDVLIFLVAIIKNNYNQSSMTTIPFFLYEIFPNIKFLNNLLKNLLITILSEMIFIDIMAIHQSAYNSLIAS